MLRIFSQLGARLSRGSQLCRYASVETQNFEDFDKEKKLKILQLEIDILRQEGRKAPELTTLKPQHWDQILTLPSKSARRRFYQYLWQNEKRNENTKMRKEQRKHELEEYRQQEAREDEENDHMQYRLYRNTMFLRLYDSTMNHWHNNKLVNAMMFNQKLVIDCSYDEHMNPREAQNAAKQLMLCFAENRTNDEPFDLQFCNVNESSIASIQLKKYIPTMNDASFPININQQSFMDMYDKNRLVYLTPHTTKDLVDYSHDDIYIIGAMVDKQNNEPLSQAKAKKLGLRMARLPLDRYLQWGCGSGKSLTLNQMVNIMLNMKKHGDWQQALKAVPRRKLYSDYDGQSSSAAPEYEYRNRGKYDKAQNGRERKHFDKFQFDLDSWASRIGQKGVKSR